MICSINTSGPTIVYCVAVSSCAGGGAHAGRLRAQVGRAPAAGDHPGARARPAVDVERGAAGRVHRAARDNGERDEQRARGRVRRRAPARRAARAARPRRGRARSRLQHVGHAALVRRPARARRRDRLPARAPRRQRRGLLGRSLRARRPPPARRRQEQSGHALPHSKGTRALS